MFDFGIVLFKWGEDKIITNYADNKEEQDVVGKLKEDN